jgi:hypothetical protein
MTNKLLYLCSAVLLLCQGIATAEDSLYHCQIRGSSSTLSPDGHIISQPLNNGVLIKQYALSQGWTNSSWVVLAYHVGGGELGDTIDLINRTNGTTVQSLIGFFYGESFGREALLSGNRRQQRRLEYIYTSQNSHSLGSALITDYYNLAANGTTNRSAHFGQMEYLVLPDGIVNTKLHINNASFSTSQAWQFP